MKKCKYCGKELHENANFCPYCMRKQINTEYVAAKSVHGLRFRWLILAGVVLIAAVFACVWILPKIYQKQICISVRRYKKSSKLNRRAKGSCGV